MLEDAINLASPDKPVDVVLNHSVVLTEATPESNVLLVTPEFEKHTGYSNAEVFGRNLRMLQGPDTSQDSLDLFRYLITHRKPGIVEVINYKKSGRPFKHCVDMRPVRNKWGTVTHFLAIQHPEPLSATPPILVRDQDSLPPSGVAG